MQRRHRVSEKTKSQVLCTVNTKEVSSHPPYATMPMPAGPQSPSFQRSEVSAGKKGNPRKGKKNYEGISLKI